MTCSADEEAFDGFLNHIGGEEATFFAKLRKWAGGENSEENASRTVAMGWAAARTVAMGWAAAPCDHDISLPGIEPVTSSTGATGGNGGGNEGSGRKAGNTCEAEAVPAGSKRITA